MKTLRYNIEISFDVENNINKADLENTLAAALSHSTAAEAIREAIFNTYGEDVCLDYWCIGD
jgi:hypothetical protein